jgi:hypothetical protein
MRFCLKLEGIAVCACVVAVVVVQYSFVGLVMGAVIVLVIIVTHSYCLVGITTVFVRCLKIILKEGEGVADKEEGYKQLQLSCKHAVLGSAIAVSCSTYVIMNAMLCFIIQGIFWRSSWLNVFVFGINMNSIFNNIGMFFVCGMAKHSIHGTSSPVLKSRYQVVPIDSFQFNSNAYNESN